MTTSSAQPRRCARAAMIATALLLGASARAGETGTRYASWHGCLDRQFAVQATIGSRLLAADAALRACRPAQGAYLDALAASPLLDADDAARAQAALVARAKIRLLGRRAAL